MKLLFKDNHFNLIERRKLQVRELNSQDKKDLGIFKKPISSYVETLKNAEKKKLKELIVIFDNENGL